MLTLIKDNPGVSLVVFVIWPLLVLYYTLIEAGYIS